MLQSLEKFDSKVFAAHLHTQFKVHMEGQQPVILELAEVNDGKSAPNVELFSLMFSGPVSPRLEQRIHRLEHDRLGTFEIFLTAVAGDAHGISYESVFHRMRKK